MPLYDYSCARCGKTTERYLPTMDSPTPLCCGEVMTRCVGGGRLLIKMKYPLWGDRIDVIHKAQAQRGERLRYVHPSEVRAT